MIGKQTSGNTITVAAGALTFILVLAACGSSADSGSLAPTDQIESDQAASVQADAALGADGAVALAANRAEFTEVVELPLAAHIDAAFGDEARHNAVESTIAECMADRGFDYAPAPYFPQEVAEIERRYGITSVVTARQVGYGASRTFEPEELRNAAIVGLSAEELASWEEALFGTDQVTVTLADGFTLQIPAGGCLDEAESRIIGDRVAHTELVYTLQLALVDSYRAARQDPRVQAAIEEWRSCMSDRGYNFEDPSAAVRAGANREAAAARDQAVADAECNQVSDLAATWSNVEAEIQNAMPVVQQGTLLELAHQLSAG